jgi:peptide/nickel transport system substrate-binding protein
MNSCRAAALLAAIVVAAGACSNSVAAGEPKRGGVLTFGVAGEVSTYDCHAADGFTIFFVAPHYSTLLRIDPDNYPRIVGDLAESWEVGDNGRTYAFRLRSGIRFHDGTALTAADVKASFDRIRDPPAGVVSVRRAQFADVSSIETPDDRRVVFHLKQPNAAMLTLLASPWNCIYSAKLLKADPDYPVRTVMGSGPFRFVQYSAGAQWAGRRFDGYFRDGLPHLDGFEAYVVTAPAVPTALEGGQIMAEFRGIPPAQRDALKQAMGDRVKFQESDEITDFQLTFNTTRKPFDDVRVRRALSMAIDRWTFEPLLRRSTVAGSIGGLLRPGSAMSRSAAELEEFPGFSRDAASAKADARRLLREAGQENLTFTLTNRAAGEPFATIGVYAVDQWRQIGVAVEQNMLDSGRWHAARFGGNFDVVADFAAEFVDEPTLQLAHYLSYDRSPDNVSRAIDRTLDDLYDRQLRSQDGEERRELVRAFEAQVLRQAYVAPIAWRHRIVPLAAKVMGYVATPSVYLNQDLATVWLDQ